MSRLSENEIALRAEMLAEKEELRTLVEDNPQLKKDFDFPIEKTRLQRYQPITGLWLDCNLMHADRQTLLRNEKMELWPISEDTLRRGNKNIRRMAREIRAINRTTLSPILNQEVGRSLVGLPNLLSLVQSGGGQCEEDGDASLTARKLNRLARCRPTGAPVPSE